MFKNCYLIISLFFIASCSQPYEYRDVSNFHLTEDALSDNEAIQILHASHGPAYERIPDYYHHLVVRSLESGDTINILTTRDNGFNKSDVHKTFYFLSAASLAKNLFQMEPMQLDNITEHKQIQVFQLKRLQKVIHNPEAEMLTSNDYPTVFGMVGFVKMDQENPAAIFTGF